MVLINVPILLMIYILLISLNFILALRIALLYRKKKDLIVKYLMYFIILQFLSNMQFVVSYNQNPNLLAHNRIALFINFILYDLSFIYALLFSQTLILSRLTIQTNNRFINKAKNYVVLFVVIDALYCTFLEWEFFLIIETILEIFIGFRVLFYLGILVLNIKGKNGLRLKAIFLFLGFLLVLFIAEIPLFFISLDKPVEEIDLIVLSHLSILFLGMLFMENSFWIKFNRDFKDLVVNNEKILMD
ncbi:MAG: hypothetical protein ACTSU2_05875 [Promethearchaeota archaeon]